MTREQRRVLMQELKCDWPYYAGLRDAIRAALRDLDAAKRLADDVRTKDEALVYVQNVARTFGYERRGIEIVKRCDSALAARESETTCQVCRHMHHGRDACGTSTYESDGAYGGSCQCAEPDTALATTRTPDAGRAEPDERDCPENSSHKGRLCGACGVCSACNVEMFNALAASTSPREGASDETSHECALDYGADWCPSCDRRRRLIGAVPPAEPDEADDEPQAGGPAMTEDEVWMVLEKHPRMIAQRAAAREAGRVEGWDEAVEECAKRVPNWSEDGRYCDLRYDIVLADILSVKLAARRPGGAAPDGRGGK